ncbi:siderophore-interacting protein [Chryseobacterium glaciei]|nr:siderophore-interacting protein [Chryseobacterium glaciei]
MELTFSSKICKVSVASIIETSPNIKTITFKGTVPNVKFRIGQAIIIRVDDINYRNYTPSKWDSELGTFEVVFHIHGNGPGSHFISNLKISDKVTVGMPRGFNIYKKEAKYHFFFGDETCISVFKILKDEINNDDNNYLGILELDAVSTKELNKIGLIVDIVPKSIDKAKFALEALNKLDGKVWDLWQNGYFYLMGNAKSIQTFRQALKEKCVQSKNIYTKPFWADGKVGL